MMANVKGLIGAAGAVCLASAVMSTAVLADDSSDPKFGYSVVMSATSDYIYRGISFNDEKPAFQPYVELTYGIGYVAFWGSNIAEPYSPFELDVYAGLRPVTGPVSWDIGVLWYTYPNSDISGDLDYVEFKVGASITPVTNLTLGLTGYVTPDQSNYGQTETIEGSVAYTLPKFHIFTPTVSGLVGFTSGDDFSPCACNTDDYTYWNAGMKLTVDKYFMDLRYWDTDISNSDPIHGIADSRFVFSAGVTLP